MTDRRFEQAERITKRLNRRRILQITASTGLTSLVGLGTIGRARATGGDERWRFSGNLSMGKSPTVVDGTVYVADGTSNLYALKDGNGEKKWQASGGSDGPAVGGGVVFTAESDVTGFSEGAGNKVWEFTLDEGAHSSPLIVDETVFVGAEDNYAYAIDANKESEIWRFETEGTLLSSPTVANGSLFISSDQKMYAIDAIEGTELWKFETSRSGYESDEGEFDPDESSVSSPTVEDGTVFGGSHDNAVHALDTTDGTEEWTFGTGGTVTSSPTVADGTVYVGSNDNNLYALNAADGSEVWRFGTDGSITAPPTVVNERVFVGSYDNSVYAVDTTDGTEVWRFETGGRVPSSAIVVNGTVFVGSVDGNLYALDAGVNGSSQDSRVLLGTHGHHNQTAERVTTVTPPRFKVSIETDAPIDVGEELTLTVNVTNVGDSTGTRSFEIKAPPFTSETHSARIESGESATTRIEFGTSAEHAGEHTFSVSSAFNTANTTVIIRETSTDTPDQDASGTNTSTAEGSTERTTSAGSNAGPEDTNTDDGSAESTTSPDATTSPGQPGLGFSSTLIGVGSAALYSLSRRKSEND